METCNCGVGLINTGRPTCQQLMDVARQIVVTRLVADDGTTNRITLASAFGTAEVTSLINQIDSSKRWFPLPVADNVEDTRAEAVYQEMASGQKIFVEKGIRSVVFDIIRQSATMIGKLDAVRCVSDIGYYEIDKSGNLTGKISSDGLYLEPIPIDNETWNADLVKGKDKTLQMGHLSFELKRTMRDEDFQMISASELAFDIVGIDGLLDINAVVSNESTTGFTVTLTLDYGTAKTKLKVIGLLVADVQAFSTLTAEKLRNVTDAADLAITSITESADGVYDFVFAAQTSADVLKFYWKKNGYERTLVTVTIP